MVLLDIVRQYVKSPELLKLAKVSAIIPPDARSRENVKKIEKLIAYTITVVKPKNKGWLRPLLEARKILLSEASLQEKAKINDVLEKVLSVNPLDAEGAARELRKLKKPRSKRMHGFNEHVASGLKLLSRGDEESKQLVEDFSFLSSLVVSIPFEGPMAGELEKRGEFFISSAVDSIGMIMLGTGSASEKRRRIKHALRELINDFRDWLRKVYLQHGIWVSGDVEVPQDMLEKWRRVLGFSPTDLVSPEEKAKIRRILNMKTRVESLLADIQFIARQYMNSGKIQESKFSRLKGYIDEFRAALSTLIPDSLSHYSSEFIQLLEFLADVFVELKRIFRDNPSAIKSIYGLIRSYARKISKLSEKTLSTRIIRLLSQLDKSRKKYLSKIIDHPESL